MCVEYVLYKAVVSHSMNIIVKLHNDADAKHAVYVFYRALDLLVQN